MEERPHLRQSNDVVFVPTFFFLFLPDSSSMLGFTLAYKIREMVDTMFDTQYWQQVKGEYQVKRQAMALKCEVPST